MIAPGLRRALSFGSVELIFQLKIGFLTGALRQIRNNRDIFGKIAILAKNEISDGRITADSKKTVICLVKLVFKLKMGF